MYRNQHCFICSPSNSTVSEDAGIEPRTIATSALAVRPFNHSARSHVKSSGRLENWFRDRKDNLDPDSTGPKKFR